MLYLKLKISVALVAYKISPTHNRIFMKIYIYVSIYTYILICFVKKLKLLLEEEIINLAVLNF